MSTDQVTSNNSETTDPSNFLEDLERQVQKTNAERIVSLIEAIRKNIKNTKIFQWEMVANAFLSRVKFRVEISLNYFEISQGTNVNLISVARGTFLFTVVESEIRRLFLEISEVYTKRTTDSLISQLEGMK